MPHKSPITRWAQQAAYAAKRRKRLRDAHANLRIPICAVCLKREPMHNDTRCAVCAEQQDNYKVRVGRKQFSMPQPERAAFINDLLDRMLAPAEPKRAAS